MELRQLVCLLACGLQAQTVRLKPGEIPGLPQPVARELARRGCTIPQSFPPDQASNAIRGSFARPGQTDWAVLCSAGGSTRLLVFWNGSPANTAELARSRDERGKAFEWYIRAVGRRFILERYRAYGGPKPPPIDHQGIESGGGSASEVLYLYRGRWLHLQGAD